MAPITRLMPPSKLVATRMKPTPYNEIVRLLIADEV